MPIQIDFASLTRSAAPPPSPVVSREATESKRLLVLMNPGRVSRHYLEGLANAAAALNVEHRTVEMAAIWQRQQSDRDGLTRDMAAMIRTERIGAVIGYVFNGAFEMHGSIGVDGRQRGFFETLGVPHLMLWTDHPQWASEKLALDPRLQTVLSSPNNHHFVKSEAAALEIRRVLGWANCRGLPVAEDPDIVRPCRDVAPDYDVVAVLGSPPTLEERLLPFLDQRDPDVGAIMGTVAGLVRDRLRALWRRETPESTWEAFDALGEDWIERRRADVRTAAVRHLDALLRDHPDAASRLLQQPKTYFAAVERLWLFGAWQRTFYLRYLANHFRVAVFGADWSGVGLGGGEWVGYRDQSAAYARGCVAINVSQGSEEEGLSHKPFQIAASGVPMAHVDRVGLADCFDIGEEVAAFDSPANARETIAGLLADPSRRESMAAAARRRVERDHTWSVRLSRMLSAAATSLSPR